MYVEGTAVVMGFEEPMLQTDDTPVKRCLQTKWPYIELLWTTDRSPSLNWDVVHKEHTRIEHLNGDTTTGICLEGGNTLTVWSYTLVSLMNCK